jgi:hypothetical protein
MVRHEEPDTGALTNVTNGEKHELSRLAAEHVLTGSLPAASAQGSAEQVKALA